MNIQDESPICYKTYASESEYLKVEETAKERHEYVAGRSYAMSGASFVHNIIVGNLARLLHNPARSSGCTVVASDMKLRIANLDTYYYPDVMVTCEKPAPGMVFVSSAVLIAEVLSPSTTSIDLREKLLAYRSLTTLREYLIVQQEKAEIDLYRKEDNAWKNYQLCSNQKFQLRSFSSGSVDLALADIYEGLDFLE